MLTCLHMNQWLNMKWNTQPLNYFATCRLQNDKHRWRIEKWAVACWTICLKEMGFKDGPKFRWLVWQRKCFYLDPILHYEGRGMMEVGGNQCTQRKFKRKLSKQASLMESVPRQDLNQDLLVFIAIVINECFNQYTSGSIRLRTSNIVLLNSCIFSWVLSPNNL